MPHISLICPVYNAQEGIRHCLESITAQTMDDIEVLLVDDHGTDESIAIAHSFVQAYTGTKQFHFLATPHNMGPGPARNLGIAEAQGDYIAFIDSDDVLSPDFCEHLYAIAMANDADLAYGQTEVIANGQSRMLTNPLVPNGEFTPESKSFFLTHFTTIFVAFLYRRKLLLQHDIHFPATRSAEDSYFLTCSLLAAHRIACTDRILYHYLVHDDSLSEIHNPHRYLDKMASFDALLDYTRRHNMYPTYKHEIDFIYLKKGYLMSAFTYIYNAEDPCKPPLRELYQHLINQIPDYASNPYYRKKWSLRILNILLRRMTGLAYHIIPIYIRLTKMKL